MKWLGKILLNKYVTISIGVIIVSGLWFYSKWAFNYIKFYSSDLTVDFQLKLIFYILLMLSSFAISLIYDAIIAKSRWVRNTFDIESDEIPDYLGVVALVKTGKIQFYFIAFISFIVLWFLIDYANYNFNSYYKTYGQYLTMLRSGNKEYKIQALIHLVGAKNKNIKSQIIKSIEKGNTQEALIISWAAAEKGVKDPKIMQAIRQRSKMEKDKVKSYLLLSLARLGDSTVYLFESAMEQVRVKIAQGRKPTSTDILTLAFIGSPRSESLLIEVIKRYPDSDAGVIAIFAIAKIRGMTKPERQRAWDILKWIFKKGPIRLKCVATVSAAVTSFDDELKRILMWEFERKEAEKIRCKPETFSLHPSGKGYTINITNLHIGGFSYLASAPERYRERILRTLALSKDKEIDEWLQKMAKNPYLDDYMRYLVKQAARKKVKRLLSVN